jgi:multicomponent K+:H+ antiporter subunit G
MDPLPTAAPSVREIVVALLLLVGAAFALIGSIGLARLPDFYARLHGPTKATTLGVGATLAASALWFSGRESGVSLHELLVAAFLFLTAPASAHLLARAALHLGVAERSRWLASWTRRGGERRGDPTVTHAPVDAAPDGTAPDAAP